MSYNSSAVLSLYAALLTQDAERGLFGGRVKPPQTPSTCTFVPKEERETRSPTHEQDRAARFALQAERRKKNKKGKKR
jgi:hypothetical protein